MTGDVAVGVAAVVSTCVSSDSPSHASVVTSIMPRMMIVINL